MPTRGGWLDQPLPLLIHMQAIDEVVTTVQALRTEGADWTVLSQQQVELTRFIGVESG